MGLFSTTLGIIGFGIGLAVGLVVGFYLFVYSKPKDVKEPDVRPLVELDSDTLLNILHEIPLWVKSPDYERVDWFNKFLLAMWPYLDKAICATIKTTAQTIFAEYIGKYGIEAIEFEHLSLGTLPPAVHGLKVLNTNENDIVLEPVVRWAGNPNITLVLKIMSLPITVQLVDLQVFAAPRISLKPLVPAFPCFASIAVSLLNRPQVDFGLEICGGDIMSIPGLHGFVQRTIEKHIANMYIWPRILDISVLDPSTVGVKMPVGILNVKVVRAMKLMKADIVGTSDPYVKLSLSGDKLSAKKTTIKKQNLNPVWNENFRLVVKDPGSQVLQLHVLDWDKVGAHDTLGMQVVPLKTMTPQEPKHLTLDLLKNINSPYPRDNKKRGQIVIELTLVHFKEDSSLKGSGKENKPSSDDDSLYGPSLLSIRVQSADDVEGHNHSNPYAAVLFKGERKRTKMIRKTRHPRWNEEFQFMMEQPPLREKIRIEVLSKRTGFRFRSRESLGYVEVNLDDVVYNGRINEKYHLINSKNGVIHVAIRWDRV
ncbi:SYT3 [Linum perenne]